ncbi:hypothetical protein LguiA_029951 [Lonicera macranthoides]
MIGLSESSKCAQIVKVFEDVYKSPLSIENLREYVAIGPRFSNLIFQTLLVLLKQLPPKGKNIMLIGTTSQENFPDSLGILAEFAQLVLQFAAKLMHYIRPHATGYIGATYIGKFR